MTHALSNPYEIIIDGVSCKSSPYGAGSYIADRDLDALNDRGTFLDGLRKQYVTETKYDAKKELEGIVVFYPRQKETTI
jgi:hypothetical protein